MLRENTYEYILIIGIILNIYIGSHAVLWPCETDENCPAEGSECSVDSAECRCKDFSSIFSNDFTKCVKSAYIGQICEYSSQCNLMPVGAICKSGICDCPTRFTYIQGQCTLLKNLDESCDQNLDCYFGYDRNSVECLNNICACASGYYKRYSNICRRKSMEINDDCVVDSDCNHIGANIFCRNYKCAQVNERVYNASMTTILSKTKKNIVIPKTIKKFTAFQQPEYSYKSIKPTQLHEIQESYTKINEKTKEKRSLENTNNTHIILKLKDEDAPKTTINKTKLIWSNDVDESWSTESNTDNNNGVEKNKFGDFCTENGKSCTGIYHSICSNNICLCKKGYYNKNGDCFAELGENAQTASQCDFVYDIDSQKCLCQSNYFYERSLRACRKPIQFHLSCTSDSQCSPFGPSYCSAEFPRRCTCLEYAEYNELEQMCTYKQGLGAECDTSDQCVIDNAVCSGRQCVCGNNFFEKNGECVNGIGANCQYDGDCFSSNSECKIDGDNLKLCQCRKGFVHFKDECLKEAENLGDECSDSEQCKLLSASCISNKCSCPEKQHFQNGRCETKRNLGEACTRAGECFTENEPENVECRNLVCQCKFKYQADVEQKSCTPVKRNSSGRPSALKYITFLLIGTAFFVTSAAIRQAFAA